MRRCQQPSSDFAALKAERPLAHSQTQINAERGVAAPLRLA